MKDANNIRSNSIKRMFQFIGSFLVFNLTVMPLGLLLAMESFVVKEGTQYYEEKTPNNATYKTFTEPTAVTQLEVRGDYSVVVPITKTKGNRKKVLVANSDLTREVTFPGVVTELESLFFDPEHLAWEFDRAKTWEELLDSVDERSEEGYMPLKIEASPWSVGASHWDVLWISNFDQRTWEILPNVSANKVKQEITARRKQGLRLVDREAPGRTDGKEILIFHENKEQVEWTTIKTSESEFFERYIAKRREGFIPFRFESLRGVNLYVILIKTKTTLDYRFEVNWPLEDFNKLNNQYVAEGFRLHDMEHIRGPWTGSGFEDRYYGIWIPNPKHRKTVVIPWTFDSLSRSKEHFSEMVNKGYRLIDFHYDRKVSPMETRREIWQRRSRAEPGREACEMMPALFEHVDYKGRVIAIDHDIPDLHHFQYEFGDSASAVCLPSGWEVTLFRHINYEGAQRTLRGPDQDQDLHQISLNGNLHWGDQVSSVRVTPPPPQRIMEEGLYSYWYPIDDPDKFVDNANKAFQYHMANGLRLFKKGSLHPSLREIQKAQSLFDETMADVFSDSFPSDLRTELLKDLVDVFHNWKRTDTSPEDIFNEVLAKTTEHPLSSKFKGQQAGFPYYYLIAKFWIPLLISDIHLESGNYALALQHLFQTYSEPSFYRANPLNHFEDMIGKRYGNDIPPGAPSGVISQAIDEGMFGKFPGDSQNQYRIQLHRIEVALVKQKIAAVYAKWGDKLYRQSQGAKNPDQVKKEAKTKFLQILRIFPNTWMKAVDETIAPLLVGEEIIELGLHPRILQMVYLADVQLQKLNANLNYLGYPDDYVPLWSYSFLRKTAKEFLTLGRELDRDALSFFEKGEAAQEQNILLQRNLAAGQRAVQLEQLRVTLEKDTVKISKQNRNLARLRVKNKGEQIREFADSWGLKTAKELANMSEIEKKFSNQGLNNLLGFSHSGGIQKSSAGKVALQDTLSGIPFVSGYFGGGIRQKERKLTLFQMEREKAELTLATDLANAEVQRAELGVEIAKKLLRISQLDLTTKEYQLQFSQDKVLSEEFWIELSKELQEKARQYLAYGNTLAWLSQQAFAFEENQDINLIRFDYISSDDRLASDQLLLDLHTIEIQRITARKQKTSYETFLFSLRDQNFLNLHQLRETGKTQFTITQEQLDRMFPGTYNRQIESVNVTLLALAHPLGIHGRLTKKPYSLLKTSMSPQTERQSRFVPDWITFTRSPDPESVYRLRMVATPQETMFFPDSSRSSTRNVEEEPSPLFHGHGVSGSWTLELPKEANAFEYDTLYDVAITIEFSTYYDETLQAIIEEERRKWAGLGITPQAEIVGFSLHEEFPDEFYHMHNPQSQSEFYDKHLLLVVPIKPEFVPSHHVGHSLTEFRLAIVGNQGVLPIKAKVTNAGLNRKNQVRVEMGRVFFDGQDITTDANVLNSLNWFSEFETVQDEQNQDISGIMIAENLGQQGAIPFDWWLVRIDAKDNQDLRMPGKETFDSEKVNQIQDVIMQLGYTYQVKGDAPTTLWADFEDDDSALTFYGKAPFVIGQEIRQREGKEPRSLPLGAQGHWRPGQVGVWKREARKSNSFISYTTETQRTWGILQTSPAYFFPELFATNYEISWLATPLEDQMKLQICLIDQENGCNYQSRFNMELVEQDNDVSTWKLDLGGSEKKANILLPRARFLPWRLNVQAVQKRGKPARKIELYANDELLYRYWDLRPWPEIGGLQIGTTGKAEFDDIKISQLGQTGG